MELTNLHYQKGTVLEWMKIWNPATIKPLFQVPHASSTYPTALLLLHAVEFWSTKQRFCVEVAKGLKGRLSFTC